MKSIFHFLLLLLLFHSDLFAQKYFEKLLNPWGAIHDARKIIQRNDQKYWVSGRYFADESYFPALSYSLILSPIGNIDYFTPYPETQNSRYFEDIVCTDTGYIAAGEFVDPLVEGFELFIQTMDINGNEIDTFIIENGLSSCSAKSIISTIDNNYITVGGTREDLPNYNVSKAYIAKISPQGEVINDTIVDYLTNTLLRDIVAAPDNSRYYCAGNINMDFTGAVSQSDILLTKINPNGTILWDTTYNPSGNDQTIEMATTPDNYILIAGGRTPDFDEQTRVGLLYKIDTMGNIIWENNLLYATYQSIRVLADGNYGIGGVIWHNLEAPYNLDAVIVKINAQTGETMWYRSYGSPTYNDYVYDFTPTPDGGFMAVGRSDSTNYAYAYLLKLNCLGLLTEPAAAFTTYQTGNSPLEVAFANASQYVYPDSIDGGYYVWDFGDGSPPFACGQGFGACPDVVLHSYAAQGQYTASLRAVVCSDTSQVAQSVVVLWNGIPIVEGDTWANVHPNPAHQSIFIDHYLSDSETAQVALYNLNGQLLQTHTVSGRGTLTLPTHTLPEGMYYCQVVQASQLVVTHKIAVLR